MAAKPHWTDIEMMRLALRDNMARASEALRAIPGIGSGAMGLTPDHVKQSPEYKAARAAYERAAADLRAYNTKHKPPRRAPSYR